MPKFSLRSLMLWLFIGAGGMACSFHLPQRPDEAEFVRKTEDSPFLDPVEIPTIPYGVPFANRLKQYLPVTDQLGFAWHEEVKPWGILGNVLFYFGFVGLLPFAYRKYVHWAKANDPHELERQSELEPQRRGGAENGKAGL